MTAALSCPDPQKLQCLLLGLLPDAEAEGLEQHVLACPSCQQTLAHLPADDTFIEGLRAGAIPPPPESRSEAVRRLMQSLSQLPALSRMSVAAADAAAPAADAEATQELIGFLAPPQEPDEIGRLGGYRVLHRLGAGGMGIVFAAEDPQLQRRVALKVMRPAVAAKAVHRQRFLREARHTASLVHDHIVTIHHVGEDRGVPFLAMQLLSGESLDARLKREGRLPAAELLRIGREAAEGLAAAHARGLVHRDIKPGNIWLEAPRGRVKLLDFGLARALGDDAQLTEAGAVVGTPSFMAPEQARGAATDARSDLFSLGAVLYRAATGELPFKGTDAMATLTALAVEKPVPPQELNTDLPPALAALIARLLSKNPKDRPTSARAVAETLEAIECGSTASAAHVAPPRRRPVRAVAVGLLGAAALVAGIVIIVRDKQGKEVGRLEVPDGGSFEAREKTAGKNRVGQSAAPKIAVAPSSAPQPGEPLSPNALVQQPAKLPGVRSWSIEKRDPAGAIAVAYRPDGKRLAVGGWDGRIRIWDATTGRLVQVLVETKSAVGSFTWSPDGRMLAVFAGTAPNEHALHVWDAEAGRLVHTLEAWTGNGIDALAWSADGRTLLEAHRDRGCLAWDAADGKLLRKVPLSCSFPVAFSPDGKQLVGLTQDNHLVLCDVETGKEVRRLGESKRFNVPSFLGWSPDGKRVAYCTSEGLRVVDVETAKVSFQDPGETTAGEPRWSPDGRVLAFDRGNSRGVRLVDVTGRAPARDLEDAGQSVLAWSPDGKVLARVSWLGVWVRLYDPATGKRLKALAEGTAASGLVSLAPYGRTLAVREPGQDCRAVTASVDTGQVLQRWKDIGQALALSPDGKVLAAAGPNHAIILWEEGGKVRVTLSRHQEDPTRLAWAPDGKRLASAAAGETRVLLWDTANAEVLRELGPYAAAPDSLLWSSDGRLLACHVANVGWHVWDVERNQPVNDPQKFAGDLFQFAPDGRSALVSELGWERSYRLVDLATGEQRQATPWTCSNRFGVAGAYSPDGLLLALPLTAPAVALVRSDLRRRIRTLEATQGVTDVAFSVDGKFVLGWGGERLHVWETDTGRLCGLSFLGEANHGLTILRDGRYSGDDQVERGIVMVVRREDGTQEVLEPMDFERKYGFKNEPARVHLLEALPPPLYPLPGMPMGPKALVREPAELLGATSWTVETTNARGPVAAVAYRPDGRQVATGGEDGTIRIWDCATGSLVRMLVGPPVRSLAWSKEGVLAAGGVGETRLWEAETGRVVRRLSFPATSWAVAWSPRHPTLAIAGGSELRLWDGQAQRTIRMQPLAGWVFGPPCWSPDGKQLAIGLGDQSVRVFEAATGKELHKLPGHPGDAISIGWSPDGSRLATASNIETTLRIWDTATGTLQRRLQVSGQIRQVAWSPDGKAIALGFTGPPDGMIDPQTGQLLRAFEGAENVQALAWSPDGRQVAISSMRGVRLHDAATGKPTQTLVETPTWGGIRSVSWSPDGNRLAVGYIPRQGRTDGVRVVEVATGRRSLPMLSEGIQAAAWSPDDKRLAAVAADASVQLWDTASSRPIRTLEGKLDPPYDVRMAWSPDGTWLAVAAVQRLLLCSTETGKVLWQNADQVAIDQLAWSPDGRRLATTDRGDKGTVRVWDADTGKRLHEFPLRSRGLAWSPDGKTLAAGPDGQEDALLIDADSGTVRLRLHPVVRVTAIRWSSDGKEVILLDEENGRSNRSVWDAATGKRLHGQTVSDHWLGAPVWSPNGRMVAFWDPSEITLTDADGQRLGVLLPFDLFGQLAVTADGHFRGSARLERLVRVVVQKRDGSSETLTPAEFEQKYGAKNDPAQVRLVE